jgi:signal transduction histidine kinase
VSNDSRNMGLAGWLALTTALLVILAVGAVSAAGVRLLRDLAHAEAMSRVELGATAAREALRQSGDDLLTATLVLGERPTLHRLLGREGDRGLGPYLERYCDGASFDACAVIRDNGVVAVAGDELDWPLVLDSIREQGQRILLTGAVPGTALMGATSTVADRTDFSLVVLRRLDSDFAARLGDRADMTVEILDYQALKFGEGPYAVLVSDALSKGSPVAGRIDELKLYAAMTPVAAASGEPVALIKTTLPVGEVLGPVRALEERMLLVGAIVALIATACGVLLGRYWTAGIRRLTSAARRIGTGDLTVSIATRGPSEVSLLGSTMEEMRKNLIELTREIRRREAQAQAVLGGMVEGVFAVDGKRRIRYMNRQAETLLGVSGDEVFGKFCGDVLRPVPDAEGRVPCNHNCPIVAARKDGRAEVAELVQSVDGRRRRVVISSADANEDIQVQVFRDETELEAARRSRDTVLANISHEFRTPLAAQQASIELLRDGLDKIPADTQKELVDSLFRGVNRLTWLIDNLLESVRIEAGQLTIRHQEVVIADVVTAARDLVEPLLLLRDQALDVASLDALPAIPGDRQRLVQVLVNLLANASKFSPRGSTIRIGAERAGSGPVTLWVDDEGPGPADPDDTNLFDQFHRSGGEDPEESGLGLGLYIVRSIVERHNGNVALLRTDEGRTRAVVSLPTEVRR